MRGGRPPQAGVTLIITLVMLVLLTLFALSAIRLANINLRIVGNYQWQKEMEVLVDSAIEQMASRAASFEDVPADRDICRDGRLAAIGDCPLGNPKVGGVRAPRCQSTRIAPGYTKKAGEIPPDDNAWVITATAVDDWSGARVTITRGLTVRQLAGNCPE